MNKYQQSIIIAALMGHISVNQVKALSLQTKASAKFNLEDWGFEPENDS